MKEINIINTLRVGGAERMLLNHLKISNNKQNYLLVFRLGPLYKKYLEEVKNIKIYQIGLGNLWKILQLIKQKDITINAWLYHSCLFSVMLKCFNPYAILHWNIRSNIINTNEKITKNTTKCVIYLLSILSRIPKKILYNSHDSQKNHELYGFKGFSEILYNFCDKDIFYRRNSSFNERFKKRLGLSPDQRIILFVGRNHPVKNFNLFKDTAKKMSENKMFVFICLGVENKTIKQDNLICFRSSKSPQYFYSISDILFQTSISESFPNVLLEASACECLLLASDVGDSNLIAHRDFLFDPHKPINFQKVFMKMLAAKDEIIIEQNKKNKKFLKLEITGKHCES